MAHVLSTGEKATQRAPGQWSKTYLAIPEYHTVYTARLNGVPTSSDMVAIISVDTEVGTLADVLPDMTLYVGTAAGAFDLGMCRIRKTPITGTFYISETSDITWQDEAFLTCVDDYSLWQKSLRIYAGGDVRMDWDVAYSDQHQNFDPVPVMGTHRVAKLTGSSVSIRLGAAADTPAWVIGSTIASRSWSVSGATLDDTTAVNPTATFTAPGTYLIYCLFTAENGKTFTGVRYAIIWDGAHPLIEHFALSNGRGSFESGAYSFDVTLFSGTPRPRSLVILCTEDYAENLPVKMPGQIEGAENILCEGWIADVDNNRTSEFGEVSFSVQSAEYWLKQIRDYPSGLEMKVGTAAAWTDMPAMTVDRAAWHFLHWRSTATRVMDFIPTGDTKLATQFATSRANLWERLVTVASPTIFASPHVDNFGRLFLEIEPQMVPESERTFPTVMTLLGADIEDGISWVRRDVTPLSMLFFSGIAVNATGGANSFFSMSPGHSYGHHGAEEAQDNYLVESQANSNQLCGLYYGWKNNPIDNLELKFTHSLRALGMFPRQYFYFEISAEDDPRGIGFAGRLIPREVQFSQDADTGFIAFSVSFEPESFEGPSINGDIPPLEGADDTIAIDFSTPDYGAAYLSRFPSLPALPYIALPPSVEPTRQPTKVIIASSYGVFYSENFESAAALVTWKSMNNGIGTDKSQIEQMVVTPGGRIYALANGKVYVAEGIGGSWRVVFQDSDLDIWHAQTGNHIWGLGVNPNDDDFVAAWGGRTWSWPYDGNNGYAGLTLIGDNAISICGTIPYFRGGRAEIVYTNNGWTVFGNQGTGMMGSIVTYYCMRLSESGTVQTANVIDWRPNYGGPAYGIAAGSQDLSYYWNGGGIIKVTADGTVFTGQSITPPTAVQGVSFSPTGNFGMGASGSTPYKTSDGGSSWLVATGVIPVGPTVWENCRDDFRWIFGGGATIRLTMDWGASYEDKSGNLLQVAPLLDISQIRYIE